MPYTLKKKVAEACILSTLLYSSETWLCEPSQKLESLYMKIIKCLLSVRQTTCNDICLLESGMLPLKDYIRHKREKYLKKKFMNVIDGSPLQKAFQLANSVETKSSKIIKTTITSPTKTTDSYMKDLAECVKNKTMSSKRMTYLEMNTLLTKNDIYENISIPEHQRVAFTRFRLSSHDLNIERGRWSRISRENGKCICDQNEIQTEKHVLLCFAAH